MLLFFMFNYSRSSVTQWHYLKPLDMYHDR